MVRKTWLGLAAAGVVVVLLVAGGALGAAYFGLLGGGDEAVDQVPAGVDSVVHVDGAITSDGPTRALLDELYNESATGPDDPENVEDALDEIEAETSLDPRAVDSMVVFGKTPARDAQVTDEQYAALVVHADWSEDEFVDAMAESDDVEYETETEFGKTVYVPTEQPPGETDGAIGVLDDGEYVVGSREAVTDALAVEAGEEDTFDGELRSAYEDTRDGLITYVARVPGERIPDSDSADSPVRLNPYRNVHITSGVYYTSADAVGVETTMYAETVEDARDVEDVTSGAVAFARGGISNESVKETLRSIEVEREDKRVVVTYEADIDTTSVLLDRYRERSGVPLA